MTNQWEQKNSRSVRRVFLWAFVACYTLTLPHVILIYNAIVKHLSYNIARKTPVVILIVMGIAYVLTALVLKKGPQALKMLFPCILIVYTIIYLEPNPNKHIHIPEYIVMAWILFEVLSLDYKGKGIFGLVFVCAALLGIVDEILQGILPDRHYGWQDMVVNSSSAIIGIFTLAGLRTVPTGNWAWIKCFKQLKATLVVLLCGTVGVVLTCVYLFDVQANLTFRGVYPSWLFVWNGLFMLIGLVVFFHRVLFYRPLQPEEGQVPNPIDHAATARLWTICPLVILMILQGIVVLAAVAGMPFG